MQILLRFPGVRPRLDAWIARPFWPGVEKGPQGMDRSAAYEQVVASEPPGSPLVNGPFRRAAQAVMRYDVFPPTLVTGVLKREPVQVGDTVGICYHFLPGVDLFFAARV